MMKKTVVLMRVSTDMQETISQKTAIDNYIQQNNVIVDEWIEEEGVSGFKTKVEDRKGLMRIKELAENEELDTVIVFNSDRLGRRMELSAFVSFLTECNVKVFSITEGLLNKGDDTDDLINTIKFWVSNYESKKTSERVKAGKKATALKGEFLGGVPNFGYKLGDKKLIINEEEASVIRLAYDLYIKGGTKTVLDTFDEKGILKRGYKWNRVKLIKTLKNSIYRGQKELNNLTIPYDESLRIVSDDVWYKAQELMKLRTTKGKGNSTKFVNRSNALLEGVLYHVCGDGKIRKLHVDYTWNKNKNKKKLYYRCSHCKSYRYEGIKKTYGGIKYNKLIEDNIKDIVSNLSLDKLEEKYNNNKGENIELLKKTLSDLSNSKKKKESALVNATKELELAFIGESSMDKETVNNLILKLKKEITEIKEKLNLLNSELNKISLKEINKKALAEKYKDFEYIYNIASIEDKKVMLQEIIDKIVIDGETVDIRLNI